MAMLVVNAHQPLDQAWKFTLREFFAVADVRTDVKKLHKNGWDEERLGGLEQHLRNMGVQV